MANLFQSLTVGTRVRGLVKSFSARGCVVQMQEPVSLAANVDWQRLDDVKTENLEEVCVGYVCGMCAYVLACAK